jgi:hypothetical protein
MLAHGEVLKWDRYRSRVEWGDDLADSAWSLAGILLPYIPSEKECIFTLKPLLKKGEGFK